MLTDGSIIFARLRQYAPRRHSYHNIMVLSHAESLWVYPPRTLAGIGRPAFCDDGNRRRTDKVKCGCTTAKSSPIQWYQNRFYAPTASRRNRMQKLCCSKQRRTNKQTDRQKQTQRFWPPRRRAKSEPQQSWHGDIGPRARSCILETFGGLTCNFAAT